MILIVYVIYQRNKQEFNDANERENFSIINANINFEFAQEIGLLELTNIVILHVIVLKNIVITNCQKD